MTEGAAMGDEPDSEQTGDTEADEQPEVNPDYIDDDHYGNTQGEYS